MNQLTKGAAIMLATMLTTAAPTARAEWAKVNIKGSLDVFGAKQDSGDLQDNLRMQNVEVKFSAELTQHVRAVVKTRIDQMLRENGQNASFTFDWYKFIDEAYIEVKSVGGKDIAFLIGKQKIPFGQVDRDGDPLTFMPFNQEGGLYSATNLPRVQGITVQLGTNVLNLVKSVEVAIFEAPRDDFGVGNRAGVAARVKSKPIFNEKVSLTASAMHLSDDGFSTAGEQRYSLGAVYENGDWTAYVEGVGFVNSKDHPGTNIGATIGVAKRVGPGRLALEHTYMPKLYRRLAIGYMVPIGDNFELGPEIMYSWNDQSTGKGDELIVGARLTYKSGDISLGTKGKALYDAVHNGG